MRKYVMFLVMLLSSTMAFSQMNDTQVSQAIQQGMKSGTRQSQVVTGLMQKGVKVDQIQRVRKQYEQNANRGLGEATGSVDNRMRQQNAATQRPESGNTNEVMTDSLGNPIGYPIDPLDTIPNLFHGREVFGRNIFNRRTLNFEPNMNLATPQNYVLGPGDVVYVDIYGASQKTEQLTVSPDGAITIPAYGPVQVSGLTVAQAQSRLRGTLGSRYASSNLKLTVGQTRTIHVNVMGEVLNPGSYTLSAFATVFHALYMAGGTNEIGTLRNIKVFRQGKLVTTVDVYQYILSGRLAGNIRLQDNDVIQVGPYDCIVDIEGCVKRPMAFEMRKSESVKTLLDYAGGFTGNAYRKSVRLLRNSGRLKNVYNINEFDMTDFKLDDGDVISVDTMLDRFENTVEIRGAVFRAGMYHLGQEVTSVKSLIEAADGLMEEAFTARAVLRRVKPNRTLEVLPIDVKGIMEGTTADVPLQNEDILLIPTIQEQMQARTVTIQGEVQFPGDYEYADNESLEDLVLRAGGLTDAASAVKVDVSRRIRDAKADQVGSEISKTFSFALKDGFVVDGDKSFTLEPYDVVDVRKSPVYKDPRKVTVEGEVLYEGSFTLSKKNQRLSDLVKAAGGVTPDAYVRGARLERLMSGAEKRRLEDAIALAKVNADARDSVSLDQLATSDSYTVGINLEKAMENPGGDYDIMVRDGDRLVIPEYNGTVKISGNVLMPNTVAYMSGKNYKFYINQAGGYGEKSRKSKTYILYQNGLVTKARKGEVEPGCEIIVPKKGKRTIDLENFTKLMTVTSSMASLTTLFFSVYNLFK